MKKLFYVAPVLLAFVLAGNAQAGAKKRILAKDTQLVQVKSEFQSVEKLRAKRNPSYRAPGQTGIMPTAQAQAAQNRRMKRKAKAASTFKVISPLRIEALSPVKR